MQSHIQDAEQSLFGRTLDRRSYFVESSANRLTLRATILVMGRPEKLANSLPECVVQKTVRWRVR
jgi:hypothetical protein